MMPDLDGYAVLRALRQDARTAAIPLIFLTAKVERQDVRQGMALGADDYVTKPFSPKELLARVEALGRRIRFKPEEPEILEVNGCRFDFGRCEIKRGNEITALTPREVGILRWMHQHRNRVVTRSELLENIWGMKSDIETRTVDMTIANLRQKIEEDPANPKIIVSVKGLGYSWAPSSGNE